MLSKCIIARMAKGYQPRAVEAVLRRAARQFPAVVLTGPRQSGKTTTLRRLFGATHRYRSLDLPDVRAAAEADPRGFLEANGPRLILDEIQSAPGLLPYVKERIDAERGRAGRYLLSGSQNLSLQRDVAETLAGRAATLTLLPFAARERDGDPDRRLPWERRSPPREPGAGFARGLWASLLRGGYPEVALQRGRDVSLWYGSYVQSYLERDVRSLREVGSLRDFRAFLETVAVRSGQLLNLADVSRDLGVALNTAKAWLSVLEATYQVIVLRPFFANLGKRLVKTPKVYIADPGLMCYLAGLRTREHVRASPLAGAVFETAVVTEVTRTLAHRGPLPTLHFWRTATGAEVDLLVEHRGHLVPLEVKASATPKPRMAAGIESLRRDLGPRVTKGFVVHAGESQGPLGPHAEALPFGLL